MSWSEANEPIGPSTPGDESELKEMIDFIARRLVDKPAEVDVREVAGEKTTVYELRVGDGDLGKIIGKHGRTIRAIRTLLSAAATKENKRAVLEILE
jgi:predicted RNA-binding protein YlqC (UPF0109 family)